MSHYIHTAEVHNTTAAELILPLVFQQVRPESVLDVGCGLGTWLAVCEQLGVRDDTGIEGTAPPEKMLAVAPEKIIIRDLTQPFFLDRKFDLVICLEVAEHLPPGAADTLVSSLVRHGGTLLFSAAIPGQGGQHHLNEQWPAYWQEKFAAHSWYFEDVIRPVIWDNAQIEWWYRQNIFLVRKGILPPGENLSRVHPELHDLRLRNESDYLKSLTDGKQGVALSVRIAANAVWFKIKNLFSGK